MSERDVAEVSGATLLADAEAVLDAAKVDRCPVYVGAGNLLAFATALPGLEMERWVLASYPEASRDILLSGWIHGEDRLARRAAAVAMTYGKGKIVLLAFRPQNRAQTHATFPFIFNSLYWSVLRP